VSCELLEDQVTGEFTAFSDEWQVLAVGETEEEAVARFREAIAIRLGVLPPSNARPKAP
jgi:predicted RNase H-like HicB family nuclease